jgi:hypothetical protein
MACWESSTGSAVRIASMLLGTGGALDCPPSLDRKVSEQCLRKITVLAAILDVNHRRDSVRSGTSSDCPVNSSHRDRRIA